MFARKTVSYINYIINKGVVPYPGNHLSGESGSGNNRLYQGLIKFAATFIKAHFFSLLFFFGNPPIEYDRSLQRGEDAHN